MKKNTKIILGILGIVIITIILGFLNNHALWILSIIFGGVAINYYNHNQEKDKQIETLRKDWRFCKELLDKERAKNKV